MINRSLACSPFRRFFVISLMFLGFWFGGCGATGVQGTTPTVEATRAWPAPLVSAWRWDRLAPLMEEALSSSHGLDVVSSSLERWTLEQGGRNSERALLGHTLAVARYALVAVTEPGSGGRPIRHYILLFERAPSPGLLRIAEAEVVERVRAQRYSDGEAYLHGFTPSGPVAETEPLFGGGTRAQLRRAWALALSEDAAVASASKVEAAMEDADEENSSRATSSVSATMWAEAQRWEAFWVGLRVPMRGAAALEHFESVLQLLSSESATSASAVREPHTAITSEDDELWFVAAGAWLGELVREACDTASWVEGAEVLSDYPALISPTGFRARPASFVRGRLTANDLRSAHEYFSAAVDGCRRL